MRTIQVTDKPRHCPKPVLRDANVSGGDFRPQLATVRQSFRPVAVIEFNIPCETYRMLIAFGDVLPRVRDALHSPDNLVRGSSCRIIVACEGRGTFVTNL